jgi:transcriptional regulator with XRE-family HTH domain
MLKMRLKELRARDRITQEQLAEAIGLERSSIGKYEGRQGIIPSVEVLKAIADYFNVTTDYLLGRDHKYEPIPGNQQRSLTVSEPSGDRYLAEFNRLEFEDLTQSETDKLAIYAMGLKAGRQDNNKSDS